jgi:Fe-S oxidoreductase
LAAAHTVYGNIVPAARLAMMIAPYMNLADIRKFIVRRIVQRYLRKLYYKYVAKGTTLGKKFQHGDIEVNWNLISRLYELSYRCTLCRRCAQSCPIGVDNGLATHELRKIFSMEMGIAPKELHEKGTVQQMVVGSSTGMNSLVVKDNIEFIDEDMTDRTGMEIKTPWDKVGADILLLHNAGEILAWPENPGAFAVNIRSCWN